MAAFRIKQKEIRLQHRGQCSGLLYLQNAAKNIGGWNKELSHTPLSSPTVRRFVIPAQDVFGCIFASREQLHCPFYIFYFSLTFCHLYTTYQ